MTNALDKCRFLRPIREVFGLQNTDLDLSDDEILLCLSLLKIQAFVYSLGIIARLLYKIVRCTIFFSFENLVVSRIVFFSIGALYPTVFRETLSSILLKPKGQAYGSLPLFLVYTSVLDNFNNFHVLQIVQRSFTW